MARRHPLAFSFAALALLGTCAGPRQAPPSAPLSPQAVVLETPIDLQDELYECGLISVSALCGFYAIHIPEAEAQRLAQTAAQEQGLSGAELRDVLVLVGFEVFVFHGTLDDSETGLRHHVDARRPLIVMTSQDHKNHYSLLIGYDPGTDSVVLLDPRCGRVVLPVATFESLWANAQCFTLLAVPEQQAARAQSVSTKSSSTRSL